MSELPSATEADLNERIRRLEASLAALTPVALTPAPATAPSEEQLAERVLSKLAERASQQRMNSNGYAPDAFHQLTPRTIYAQPLGNWPAAPMEPPPLTEMGIGSWYLSQYLSDWKLLIRMYFDPRYRLSRVAQFGVPAILVVMFFNYLFFNSSISPAAYLPIINLILERFFIILLGIGLFKILVREVNRYKKVLQYLAQHGFH